jgi:hypothetical protein
MNSRISSDCIDRSNYNSIYVYYKAVQDIDINNAYILTMNHHHPAVADANARARRARRALTGSGVGGGRAGGVPYGSPCGALARGGETKGGGTGPTGRFALLPERVGDWGRTPPKHGAERQRYAYTHKRSLTFCRDNFPEKQQKHSPVAILCRSPNPCLGEEPLRLPHSELKMTNRI